MSVVYCLSPPTLLGLYPCEPGDGLKVLDVVRGSPRSALQSVRFELIGNSDSVPDASEVDWCLPFGESLIRRDSAIPRPLLELMGRWGKWVSLGRFGGEEFSLYIPSVIDAFDASASEFQCLPAGENGEVERYAFHGESLACPSAFRVEGLGFLFALEPFRQAAIDAGLQGVEFVEVWRDGS